MTQQTSRNSTTTCQLKKEREAILANPEKHEGQLDDASDALKTISLVEKATSLKQEPCMQKQMRRKRALHKNNTKKSKRPRFSAREYQKLYKEFQSKRGVFKKMWQGLKGGTVDFDDVPEMAEAMKAAQSKYQEALAGYGNDLTKPRNQNTRNMVLLEKT